MVTNKQGQSTLEYILLVTAVVVIIIALIASPNSFFKTTLNATLNGAVNQMNHMSSKWQNAVGN